MHDPSVVAFTIPMPVPTLLSWTASSDSPQFSVTRHRSTNPSRVGQPVFAWWRPKGWLVTAFGKEVQLRTLVTIWHREPGGADSGDVCKHYYRTQGIDGDWETTYTSSWKWHVHHWHLQIHPWQTFARAYLTRCAVCDQRQKKGHPLTLSVSNYTWYSRWLKEENPERWWRRYGARHFKCPVPPAVWEIFRQLESDGPRENARELLDMATRLAGAA